MRLTIPVLIADKTSYAGRVYPRALIDKIVREAIPERVWVCNQLSEAPDLLNVGGCVRKFHVEQNTLMAEIEFARNENGAALGCLALEGVSFVTSGIGTVNHGIVQDDYKLMSLIPCEPSFKDWRLKQAYLRKRRQRPVPLVLCEGS